MKAMANSKPYCNPKTKKCQLNCVSGFTMNPWSKTCQANKGKAAATSKTTTSKAPASTSVPCSMTSDCTRAGTVVPSGANRWCDATAGVCSWRCMSKFQQNGQSCVPIVTQGQEVTVVVPTVTATTFTTTFTTVTSSSVAAPPPVSTAVACSATKDCTTAGTTVPANANRWCDNVAKTCSWRCMTGFTQLGQACVDAGVPATTTVVPTLTATSAAPLPTYGSDDGFSSVDFSALGINQFGAPANSWNTNQLFSWFRTNNPADYTNGNSWCYRKYGDYNIAAIPVGRMLANFGNSNSAAGRAYCGLEVEVTVPSTGKTMTMIVGDGFDDTWVKTPAALDITTDAFWYLFGRQTWNKNDVLIGNWRFTGRRDDSYVFNDGNPCPGCP
ncbi:hypothetical protein OIO90_003275 [Microbotryomycetes sp. JL221]|nr:hypothetical protein OIO90_003275 [Microbotryomycetes sp. JL221]